MSDRRYFVRGPALQYSLTVFNRLSVSQLHTAFVADLEHKALSCASIDKKPLEVICVPPMRTLRVYIYNLTKPPGGRSENEYKIQIIIPGQARGERGNFDFGEPNQFVMLVGFDASFGVWVLWDAYLYRDIGYSRNVQVSAATLIKAASSGIGQQIRETKLGTETVVACSRRNLVLAVQMRLSMWARDTVKKA